MLMLGCTGLTQKPQPVKRKPHSYNNFSWLYPFHHGNPPTAYQSNRWHHIYQPLGKLGWQIQDCFWFCISKFAELEVKTTKQSKTRATKLWLVLVLHLIGWESGASFLDQSQSKKAKQSQITFESKLKSVLHTYPNLVWNAAEVIWRTGSLRWSWTKRKAISVHILWLYSHLKFLGISYL